MAGIQSPLQLGAELNPKEQESLVEDEAAERVARKTPRRRPRRKRAAATQPSTAPSRTEVTKTPALQASWSRRAVVLWAANPDVPPPMLPPSSG